jgi:hypothetical protein
MQSNVSAVEVFKEGVAKYDTSRAWAAKHLHPPSPMPPNYAGYPDNNNSPSVHTEFRLTQTNVTAIDDNGNKDFIFLQSPGVRYPIFQATQKSNLAVAYNNIWTVVAASAGGSGGVGQYNTQFNLEDAKRLASIRPAYRSTTYYLNTNELTNKGTVTCGSFRPNVTKVTNTTTFRDMYAHCNNVEEIASRIEEINKAKFDYDFVSVHDSKSKIPPAPPRIIGAFEAQIIKLGDAILNETSVSSLSPKSTTWLAKEGAYVRSFISQPVNNYINVGNNYRAGSGQGNDLTFCMYEFVDVNGVPTLQFFTGNDPNKPEDALHDFDWGNMIWTYVYFSEVDPASNITMKTLFGWEMQPLVGSILATQSRPCALPDNVCLESVATIACVAPDALEAKYNDDGPTASAKETLSEAGPEGATAAAALKAESAVNAVGDHLVSTPKIVKSEANRAAKNMQAGAISAQQNVTNLATGGRPTNKKRNRNARPKYVKQNVARARRAAPNNGQRRPVRKNVHVNVNTTNRDKARTINKDEQKLINKMRKLLAKP